MEPELAKSFRDQKANMELHDFERLSKRIHFEVDPEIRASGGAF